MTDHARLSRRSLLAAVGATTLLAACSSEASQTGSSSSAAGKPSNEPLRVGAVSAGGPPMHDPHGSLFAESDWVRLAAIYDTLVAVGDDGAPAPGIATEWKANKDATEWTFTLRKDAKFSDGRPVTAADVMFSLERIGKKAAENGGRLGVVDMAKSKADGDHTVVLKTSTADAALPQVLAGTCFVVPKGTKDFAKAIGSGPFILKTITNAQASLDANPDWWGEVKSKKLVVRPFADPSAMTRAVTSGSIDVALGVEATAAKSVAENSDLQVVRRPAESTTPLLMRLDKAPFTEPKVREAIKLGLDRKKLVDTVHLGFGVEGADLPQPNDASAPDLKPPARDVAKAKELLKEAGKENLKLELHTTTAYASMPASAKLIKQQLADIGIEVEITTHPPEKYWASVYTKVPFSIGYYSQMAYPVWVRQTALSTSGFNETGWKNKKFDDDFTKAMSTVDEAKRNELLGGMQRTMAKEGGIVAWGHADGLTVARKSVKGLGTTPGQARLRLAQVSV